MCPGAESRGININVDVNGEPVASKGGVLAVDYHDHEDIMRASDIESNSDSSSRRCTSRFIQSLQHLHQLCSHHIPAVSTLEVKEDLLALARIACPIILTSVLIYSRSAISLLYLGKLGKAELAGGSLAIGFGNITCNSIIRGLSTGMDPICCQAFGAKRWSVLSQTFSRMLCILLLVSIPISILWLHVDPILQMLGQDPDIAQVARAYLVYYIPELLAQAHLNPLRSFLRNQGLTTPLTVAATCSALLHFPVNYFLASYLKLGARGVALATGVNTINMNLGLVVYLLVSDKPVKPWKGTSLVATFQGWRPLLSLALPSAVTVCLEWWWYEIVLFLCGVLPNPQNTVAAMGILIQVTSFLYIFPFSISAALSTRVGQSLGAGQPERAYCTALMGIGLAFTLAFLVFLLLISMRSVLGRLYTNEKQILDLVAATLPILGLCEMGNWPQTAGCGILTGTARPQLGARINLCAFYFIGFPVAIFATFIQKMGFLGLWLGMLAAQFACVCLMVYTLIHTDWGHQMKRAKELTLATVTVQEEKGEEDKEDEEGGLLSSDS